MTRGMVLGILVIGILVCGYIDHVLTPCDIACRNLELAKSLERNARAAAAAAEERKLAADAAATAEHKRAAEAAPVAAKQADEDAKKPAGWSLTGDMRNCLENSALIQFFSKLQLHDGSYATMDEITARCDVRWYEKGAARLYVDSVVEKWVGK